MDKHVRTFKYRLYPTKKQVEKLEWVLLRCCELYNAALQERREAWKYAKKSISYYDQTNQLPEIKEIREEYKDIYAQVLYDPLRRLDRAFKRFFRRVKNGEKPGYPRFRSHKRYDSFTYPQVSGTSIAIAQNRIALPKIGHIKIRLYRPVQGTIKTCTIKRETEHWYVVFACEVEACPRLPYIDDAVGIDLGISKLVTLSTGDVIENPRHYRRAEKKLVKLHQKADRRKRGSHRQKKAYQELSRAYRKVRNQRIDYLHKHSRWLVDTYETIVFEDIAPSNLSRRAKPKQDENGKYLPNGASAKSGLNKSILDAGWHQFITFCQYKAESAGTMVVLVDPRYTSQICSSCGTIVKKELSERWHSCECGCELDRDHNAAINIKNLWLGRSLQEQS